MHTCTVLIPNVDTPHYVYGSVDSIRRNAHKDVSVDIIIADQSNDTIHQEIKNRYVNDQDVQVIKLSRVDAGYPIDAGCHLAKGEYFCSLDCDAFAISDKWLYLPIQLIEKFGYDFVGQNTGLGDHPPYKAKGEFTHINNYYRVSKTTYAKMISDEVGFMRPSNRYKVGYTPKNNVWGDLACDNGVIAQWYSDRIKTIENNKFSFPLTQRLGLTNKMGVFGMNISGLVLHLVFGYGQEWISDMNDVLGEKYLALQRRIQTEGVTDSLLKELLSNMEFNDSQIYRTNNNVEVSSEVNDFIKSILNED